MTDELANARTELASPSDEPARPASTRLAPGTVVDGYVLEEFRGAGGMGAVYRARDARLGRDVALKVVNADRLGGSRCGVLCSLLVGEAQVMARLSHPNLISVYSVGEHAGCVYVAMEYVDGTTLADWSADRPWPERLAALLVAGRGLYAAHQGNVIHRDFKPDNVMVTRSGGIKVMDFGLARSATDMESSGVLGACASCAPAESVASVQDLRALVGTPRYMAPEIFESVPADARSDQYAFAVSCWELVYSAPPFAGRTPAELYFAKKEQDPPAPGDATVPAEVERVLRRALAPSPSRRYPSVEDLSERLARAAGLDLVGPGAGVSA